MVSTVLQLHKRSSYEYKFIQDKYGLSGLTGTYCIADGTTQSFQSERWAKMLTESFSYKPSFEPDTLLKELNKQALSFQTEDFSFSQNPAKASLERAKISYGGSSTFVGVRIQEFDLSIISVGDSNVFILSGDEPERLFPFTSVNELDSNKEFLNTEEILKDKVGLSFFKTAKYSVQAGDIIVLATDALSRLILSNPAILKKIVAINSFDELLDFCTEGWMNKSLEEDDITALIIQVTNPNIEKLIIPPVNFKFEKEADREFIPVLPSTGFSDSSSVNQSLVYELACIKQELKSVNKELLKLTRVGIAIIFISLISLTLSVSLLFFNRIPPEIHKKEAGSIHKRGFSKANEQQEKSFYSKLVNFFSLDNTTNKP